jgi:hypothetical protein
MAIYSSLQDTYPSPQLVKLGRNLTKCLVSKIFSVFGITTIVMCQVPSGEAQQHVTQLTRTNGLRDRIEIAKLAVRGVDKLRTGNYDGAIADFRQLSTSVPRREGISYIFASYEQTSFRRRSLYKQASSTKSAQRELQNLKTLMILGQTMNYWQSRKSI